MAKEKLTRRMVTQSVTVVRDGKRQTPEIGKPFGFTRDEIKYLDRISPTATRKSVNEDEATAAELEAPEGGDTGDDATAPEQNAEPTAKKSPRKAPAKKKAAAKKAEPEPEPEDEDETEDADDGDDGDDDDI